MLKSFVTAAALFSCLMLSNSCQEDFDQRLCREAREYTQHHCPNPIEVGNTLDSATYDISSRTYTHWYSLSGEMDTPQAHQAALGNMEIVKKHLNEQLIGDTKWQTCKEHNINFSYAYRSARLQRVLFRVTLTPEDYNHR